MKRISILVSISLLFLFLALVVPGIASNYQIPDTYVIHAVVPEDKLWDLAKYHMPDVERRAAIDAIKKANGMPVGYVIKTGDIINIPSIHGSLSEGIGPEYDSEENAHEAELAFEEVLPVAREEQMRLERIKPLTVSRNKVRYTELTMEATAYSNHFKSTGKTPDHPAYGITKTGLPTDSGVIAADPNVIPLGTVVWVEGYGYAVTLDIGGVIKGNIIDAWFATEEEALDWGRRKVRVRVFE
ncbi:MAG: 3D domain-containing protein [Bacillota bacterium]|nr:3D domain-containing protein [Bacillota bacterium]